MNIIKNQTGILSFVPDLWCDIWQSRHHVLSGLSEHYKVLWVSLPNYWQMGRNLSSMRSISDRAVKKPSNRFWTYENLLPANYKLQYSNRGLIAGVFRVYHKIWIKYYIEKIKRLLRHMGIKKVILYIWRPEFHWAVGKFDEILTCYHIDDEYGFSPDQDMPIGPTEMKLIKLSDLVFIHSRTLMAKKGYINPNTNYLPNGVDFVQYQKVMQSNLRPPEDIAEIPGPRIGYVGYIKRHIDLRLLISLSQARRHWSLILIGPTRTEHTEIEKEIEKLKQESNVYFLGGKPQNKIPQYIKELDVCLMPYRKTSYTKYIYPMKLHEYLACGKPVVATFLENLKEFSNVIQFANTAPEWIDSIDQAVGGQFDEYRKQRLEIAEANSWQSRIDLIKTKIIEL